MEEPWPEIERCLKESRHELVLKGNEELKKRVVDADGHLPSKLYKLHLLNFFEVNGLGIKHLSEEVDCLSNLTQLFLQHNQLNALPNALCTITSLKVLDVSKNLILELPVNIGKLVNLHTLNVSNNKLENLPESFSQLSSLAVLHIPQNNFTEFPNVFSEEPLCNRLAELYLSHNQIDDIPDSIENLSMLKVCDASDNEIKELTQAIGKCLKLKQTNFKNNALKDRRLKKLIDQGNSQKSILDYIRSKGRKKVDQANQAEPVNTKGARKKLKNQKVQAATMEQEKDLIRYTIEVVKLTDGSENADPFRIIALDEVKEVRPFIVGCLIKYIDLESDEKFKSFITLQTRLHEGICQKRTAATIATHDLQLIPGLSVCYDALDPATLKITPLGKKSEVTALAFYQKLCKEADDVRKEKKRNQVSGLYKYLNLLKDKEKFACLRRISDDSIMSLPPLTNCDVTKISPSTTHVFVEVTGTKSLNICKSVLDEMLKMMVELGFYSNPPKEADFYDDSSDEADTIEDETPRRLIVQQVRVETEKGDVKVVYPSRTDLVFEAKEIKIVRRN